VIREHPEVAEHMAELLRKYVGEDRDSPPRAGKKQRGREAARKR
jgi:hypothetical protein